MEISALRRKPLYKSLYIFWGYFLVIFFIPFTSLSFFNYKIFKEVIIQIFTFQWMISIVIN